MRAELTTTMQKLALLAAAATALQRPPVIRRVEVEVTRQLDGVSPEHAREAWLDYSWTSGGGIPALVLREPADAKLPAARTLVPAGLREELAYVDETADEVLGIRSAADEAADGGWEMAPMRQFGDRMTSREDAALYATANGMVSYSVQHASSSP